jgi:hypothetical protein
MCALVGMLESIPSQRFLEDLENLDQHTKDLLSEKITIAKMNPFHYRDLHAPELRLFRNRFSYQRKEKRLIYFLDGSFLRLLCILDRYKEYKDLEAHLQHTGLRKRK